MGGSVAFDGCRRINPSSSSQNARRATARMGGWSGSIASISASLPRRSRSVGRQSVYAMLVRDRRPRGGYWRLPRWSPHPSHLAATLRTRRSVLPMSGQPAPVADLEVSGHLADDCSLSRVGVVLDRRRVAVAGQIDDDVWTRQVIDHRLPGGAVGGQAMQEDDGGRAPGPNGRDDLARPLHADLEGAMQDPRAGVLPTRSHRTYPRRPRLLRPEIAS